MSRRRSIRKGSAVRWARGYRIRTSGRAQQILHRVIDKDLRPSADIVFEVKQRPRLEYSRLSSSVIRGRYARSDVISAEPARISEARSREESSPPFSLSFTTRRDWILRTLCSILVDGICTQTHRSAIDHAGDRVLSRWHLALCPMSQDDIDECRASLAI
jgi:hypothetical protein